MKLEALDHPKTLDLASRLNIELPTAIGLLELLWAFTGKKAPQGNIGKWPDGAIARACYWMGDPNCFLQSLLQAGFIDSDPEHRYVIHDWREHAPRWVRAKLAKLRQEFIGTTERTAVVTTEATADDDDEEPDGEEETVVATTVSTAEPPSKGSEGKCSEEKGREVKTPAPDGAARKRAVVRPEDVPENVWGDFQAIRKAKRAPLTQTALEGISREASKAGITLRQALETCCKRGWQGFEAEWLSTAKTSSARAPPRDNFAGIDYGTGGKL